MQRILTLFDYNKNPPLPLQTIVVDNGVKVYTLFLQKTDIKIRKIYENKKEIAKLFKKPTCVNDFKAHLKAFDLKRNVNYKVYDLNLPKINLKPKSEKDGKVILAKIAKSVTGRRLDGWQKLMANASVVYQNLEDRGIRHGYKLMRPRYSLETFSGRSKTSVFNIQGTTDEYDVQAANLERGYFVHLDWIGADLLMAAHMSGDREMIASFEDSDPYSLMVQLLDHPDFNRERCKRELMRVIYSLDIDDVVLDIYPDLRRWMRDRLDFLKKNGYLTSILGRRFYLRGDNRKSVFNAQMQGSVAHAMQSVLTRLFGDFGPNLITEIHDSIVLSCQKIDLPAVIEGAGRVMLDPLEGFLEKSPIMPVRISVGKRWRKWKKLKELRPKDANVYNEDKEQN